MSSKSSVSNQLTRKRIRHDPSVTLAHASDAQFHASIPTGIPLAGPSDRRSSGASSHEVELPQYQPEGTSGGDKGGLVDYHDIEPKSPGPGLGHGISLSDCNEVRSAMTTALVDALTPAGGRFYISLKGGCQLVKSHNSQVSRLRWSRYFFVEISKRTIGEFSKPIRAGWNFHPVEPTKKKTHEDSVVTLLRRNKQHIRHWPDFLSFRIHRSYPRFSSGDFYIPLEDSPPRPAATSSRKKSSTRTTKKKTQPKPKKSLMAILKFDVVDSDEQVDFPEVAPPAERAGLRPEEALIALGKGKGLMGGLLVESRRAEATRLEREEAKKNKKEESERKKKEEEKKDEEDEVEEDKREEVSGAESQVERLKSSSEDDVARVVGEAKKKEKSKLKMMPEVMEARSKAQTEDDRLSSLASQVVGVLGRIEKAKEQGIPIDEGKKGKLEARLAKYNADTAEIILPPIPEDSYDDEIVDGRLTVAGKTPALSRAEVALAAVGMDEGIARDEVDKQVELAEEANGDEDNRQVEQP
ncbi:hypothetical protein AALP_AA8G246900 [Arabis alpina]|uniref:Uncharacterized protein n=1 Tax=Arabis alpina TaxID=50452 RepID=A0A087G975_ARAAL|nr:hypothetical protein AALP_AA8G246900 [Arabis alpina]